MIKNCDDEQAEYGRLDPSETGMRITIRKDGYERGDGLLDASEAVHYSRGNSNKVVTILQRHA